MNEAFGQFLAFAGEHPILGVIFGMIFASIIGIPFRFVGAIHKRAIRSRDIRAVGWPPPHLDADGDFQKQSSSK